MKILVRLPNWLGDMVMSVAMIRSLPVLFPGATISIIAKKGIHELLSFFPESQSQYVFSKEENAGMSGLWRFGRSIKRREKFDLFFCLPDSFSSAFMGFATGAANRVGFKNELRSALLTHAYAKPKNLHRVETYLALPARFAGKALPAVAVQLHHKVEKQGYVVININSEATSRRLTVSKAVALLTDLRAGISQDLVLIGARGEQAFVQQVFDALPVKKNVTNIAGTTSLVQLAKVLAGAQVMLSTDSGPAHLANALGTQTLVLFGAGNENITAPYNKQNGATMRLGKLSCEPCQKNTCVQFSTPQCLELLDTKIITEKIGQFL